MSSTPPHIATIVDVRSLGERPYSDFMPHRRILEALEDVARHHPHRTALTGIDIADTEAPVRR
jgi:hypothetical protein